MSTFVDASEASSATGVEVTHTPSLRGSSTSTSSATEPNANNNNNKVANGDLAADGYPVDMDIPIRYVKGMEGDMVEARRRWITTLEVSPSGTLSLWLSLLGLCLLLLLLLLCSGVCFFWLQRPCVRPSAGTCKEKVSYCCILRLVHGLNCVPVRCVTGHRPPAVQYFARTSARRPINSLSRGTCEEEQTTCHMLLLSWYGETSVSRKSRKHIPPMKSRPTYSGVYTPDYREQAGSRLTAALLIQQHPLHNSSITVVLPYILRMFQLKCVGKCPSVLRSTPDSNVELSYLDRLSEY